MSVACVGKGKQVSDEDMMHDHRRGASQSRYYPKSYVPGKAETGNVRKQGEDH